MGNNPFFQTTKGILRKLGGDIETHKYRLGSIEGKKKIEIESIPLYKVSDEIPDVNSFIRGSGILGGEELNFTIESFTVIDFGGGLFMGMRPNAPIGVVVYSDELDFETGVYLTYFDEENRTSYIEFADTIVPIDPKYLPGVCLPVVELTTMPTEEGAALSESESAAVQAAFDTGMPCVIKCTIHEDSVVQKTSSVFQHAQLTFSDGELSMFARADAGYIHRVVLNDGTWVFRIDVLG